jgi:hypothetical protein
LRVITVQRVFWRVGIQDEVDASICEGIHAGIMVQRIVDRVDSDGVDAEFLEVGDITGTDILVGKGIRGI